MARKRLTPPNPGFLTGSAAPETKALQAPFGALSAPIARVAGEASATAALQDLADEMRAARAEGRLVQRLPLEAVEVDHLVRDRILLDPEEMAALRESLRARGQQSPVEVVDLGQGRYGLISGWRRLTALRQLFEETGDPRFSAVQALLRRPDGASAAYLAMVEENEIRVGLSHYERARIAAKATDQGVFASDQAALRHLYATASRSKRSNIGSFVTLHRAIGGALRFPASIPERLGLALAQALEADPALTPALIADLTRAAPASAAREQALLAAALRPAGTVPEGANRAASGGPEGAETLAPGIWLHRAGPADAPRYTLSGPGLNDSLLPRLAAWLREAGGS
jgi:ParB family chromosome partitioning protein